MCRHECECKEEAHTQAHILTHSHTRTHASTAAACESKEQKKERARIRWMLLLATSRRAVASFRMWLCLWIDDASDERPLVAADTGDEQQQVGGAGAVLCNRSYRALLLPQRSRISNSNTVKRKFVQFIVHFLCDLYQFRSAYSIAKYSYRYRYLCGFHLRVKRKKYHTQ